MKTLILTGLITLSFVFVWGQNKSDTLKNINQKVLLLNKETKYQIATLKDEAFLDTAFTKQPGKGYGQLTGYYKNNTIYKIREFIGISLLHDMAITEYYFSDGKLIYVKETETYGPDRQTDSLGTVDHKKFKADFEGGYYFTNDKMIGTTKKGEQQILPNEMYFDSQSKEGQLLLSAQKYMKLLSEN